MQNRSPGDPESRALNDSDAARVFERASELDAAQGTDMPVSDLRAAATEAGISAPAFNAALAEMQVRPGGLDDTRGSARRAKKWALSIAAVVLVAVGFALTRGAPAGKDALPAPATLEEDAILLRCLEPGDAAELVRPLLGLPTNTVVVSPSTPHTILIRATPDQMQRVRSLLDRNETGPDCQLKPAR